VRGTLETREVDRHLDECGEDGTKRSRATVRTGTMRTEAGIMRPARSRFPTTIAPSLFPSACAYKPTSDAATARPSDPRFARVTLWMT
jgi:hypothetical protein